MKKTLLTQALQYAELSGFSIIPIRKDKKPLLASWKKYQTERASEAQIRAWWAQWPDANIGIVTGAISGILVVDVDVHKGADPKPFPKTYTVKTGNGGLQLYYKHHEGYTVSSNAYSKYPHVDIRSETGYTVAPPSVTDYVENGIKKGGTYEIVENIDFSPFPSYLFPSEKKDKKISSRIAVSTGSRNSSMASIIGTIIQVMPESKMATDGWDAVVAINNTYNPPLSLDELRTVFESIVNKECRRRSVETKKNENIELLFIYNKEGKKVFTLNTENIYRILKLHSNFERRFRFDSFKNIFEIKPTTTDTWRQLEDNDAVNIQTSISILFPAFSKVGKEMVYDAIIKVSKEQKIDSAIDYMEGLVWDKIPRLDTWLSSTYGTPNDLYHRAAGSNWLKGMVKRLIEPGCKFDFVLVLEGKQGVKKSTSLHILGGDWHVETTMSTDSKDFFLQFSGKSIIEFSEGETLSRTEVKRMKAIITMQYDRLRAPYERSTQDFPRRCVFAMTTNQTEYLKDETGNRRWLPVAVLLEKANVEWLQENREQLFAEAYYRVKVLKETVYEFPEKETTEIQDARRIKDPNAELVSNWYWNVIDAKTRLDGITIHQVYRDALNNHYPTRPMTKWDEMSIADILKNHLKLLKKPTNRGKVRAIHWFNPDEEVVEEGNLLELAFKQLES